MKRGRRRNEVPVRGAAADVDSAAGACAIARAAAAMPVDTRANVANLVGRLGYLNRPGGGLGRNNIRGRIQWLVDQAQLLRNGKKSWLARISSAKKRPRENNASSTNCCMGQTMELTPLMKTIHSAPQFNWRAPRSIRSPDGASVELQTETNSRRGFTLIALALGVL